MRNERPAIRCFEHFPEEDLCPVCNTNDDGKTVLVAKDGTQEDRICEAVPVHIDCALCTNVREDMNLMYRRY